VVLFVVAGLWQDQGKSTLGAVHGILCVHGTEARRTKLDSLWDMFLEWHCDDVLLRHPNYIPRGGESKLVYHPPIMNCSTAAYEDVEKVLETFYQELIVGKSAKNSNLTLQEPFLKLTNSIKHPNLPQQNSNAVQKKRRYPLIKFSRAFAASWS
jgi:hypothetical protein